MEGDIDGFVLKEGVSIQIQGMVGLEWYKGDDGREQMLVSGVCGDIAASIDDEVVIMQ